MGFLCSRKKPHPHSLLLRMAARFILRYALIQLLMIASVISLRVILRLQGRRNPQRRAEALKSSSFRRDTRTILIVPWRFPRPCWEHGLLLAGSPWPANPQNRQAPVTPP